ncbi:MAG: HlyD family type I secretion periplasmic adaptor subunit [Victivallaceae bacterium]|nr:HlyD family type I secretion periplasmic adaptor subunit [Victivallaceae bacterium]
MGNKDKELVPAEIIEFQPDAIELKNERLPLGIRLCMWAPVAAILIAIIWASCSKVDVIVPVSGKIVTNTQTIVMKPLERTIVKTVEVKIGDIVDANQVLITFDPTSNRADSERLKNELAALNAQFDRLSCEFNYEPYNPDGDTQFERWQLAIYKQRQGYYKERLSYFDESLSQIDASYKSTSDSYQKQSERLTEIGKLEEMYDKLHGKKVASLKELIEMRITRMEMESTVDQLKNNLLELNHRKGSVIAEKNSFIQEWRKSLSEEMVAVERNLTTASKESEKAEQLIEYVYLRSPCRAVVHELAAFSPGSAVREAEALLTLIPIDENLEFEARLLPQDIGRVKVGDEVRIKLDAYPFQKFGTLDGRVRNISADTINADRSEMAVDESGRPQSSYYRARITVSGKLNIDPTKFHMVPGMQAQGEIKTGRRRLIEYALYPFLKAIDEAAREP